MDPLPALSPAGRRSSAPLEPLPALAPRSSTRGSLNEGYRNDEYVVDIRADPDAPNLVGSDVPTAGNSVLDSMLERKSSPLVDGFGMPTQPLHKTLSQTGDDLLSSGYEITRCSSSPSKRSPETLQTETTSKSDK
jgi:hypothetical protein